MSGTTDERSGDESLTLSAALKLAGLAETGGHAKRLIQGGEVTVNGAIETRRKRRLRAGDEIEVGGETFVIDLAEDDDAEDAAAEDDADASPGTPER